MASGLQVENTSTTDLNVISNGKYEQKMLKPEGVPKKKNTWPSLVSGALAGTSSVLLLQPLDLIKTRMQEDHVLKTASILQTTRNVINIDGVRGLWKGTFPTILRNVPGVSMYFYFQAATRNMLGSLSCFQSSVTNNETSNRIVTGKQSLNVVGNLLVGAFARGSVGLLVMPMTTLKTVSESSLEMANLSTIGQLRAIYQHGGVPAFWRGSVPTILRDVPGAGLFIVFYENISKAMATWIPATDVSNHSRGASSNNATTQQLKTSTAMLGGGTSAAAASALATIMTTPFDVLKTRQQLTPDKYKGMLSSFILIVKERGGFFSLWDGALLRITRKAGSSAVGWAIYEGFMSKFE